MKHKKAYAAALWVALPLLVLLAGCSEEEELPVAQIDDTTARDLGLPVLDLRGTRLLDVLALSRDLVRDGRGEEVGKKLLPLLRNAATAEDPARVINIGSVDGIKTPIFENFSYGPSKAAVHYLTRMTAAHLVKQNILVNAIAPGFFVTDLTASVWQTKEKREWIESRIPLGRPGTPDDIVGTIVYLVSPASDYLTGRVIFLDGGWMAS